MLRLDEDLPGSTGELFLFFLNRLLFGDVLVGLGVAFLHELATDRASENCLCFCHIFFSRLIMVTTFSR